MRSSRLPGLMLASILASTALLFCGCAGVPLTVVQPTACSSLIPPTLRADVPPVDLPSTSATAGDLWVAFDGQTGRLDTSNAYRRAILETLAACEARDAETARRLTRPWWRVWG